MNLPSKKYFFSNQPQLVWLSWCILAFAILCLAGFVMNEFDAYEKRIINGANKSVAEAVFYAERELYVLNYDKAEALTREALDIANGLKHSNAVNKSEAEALLIKIAKARVSMRAANLLKTAQERIQQLEIEMGMVTLHEIIEIDGLPEDTLATAKELFAQAKFATSADNAKDTLMQLSDEQFTRFIVSGELPASETLSVASLNSIFYQLCCTLVDEVYQAREERNHRRVAATKANERRESIGKELATLDRVDNPGGRGNSISRDRRFVASPVVSENTIYVWDIVTGQKIAGLSPPREARILLTQEATAFSPDSAYLASVIEFEYENKIVVWNLKNGQVDRLYDEVKAAGGGGALRSLALSDKFIVAAGKHRNKGGEDAFSVRVWDRSSGELTHSFIGHSKAVTCVAISPDGRRVASGGEDRIAIIWELASGRELFVLDGHDSTVETVSFSPDGNSILTGGFDCSARLWDANSGTLKEKWTMGSYDSLAESEWRLANTAANLRALTTGRISDTRYWNYPRVCCVDFSPDGNHALVGLSVSDPALLVSKSNPVILDLVTGEIVEMPPSFMARPMSRVWSAFNEDGSAVVFNKERVERVRGQDYTIHYLSVTGVP